jgi:hypothetical protein
MCDAVQPMRGLLSIRETGVLTFDGLMQTTRGLRFIMRGVPRTGNSENFFSAKRDSENFFWQKGSLENFFLCKKPIEKLFLF